MWLAIYVAFGFFTASALLFFNALEGDAAFTIVMSSFWPVTWLLFFVLFIFYVAPYAIFVEPKKLREQQRRQLEDTKRLSDKYFERYREETKRADQNFANYLGEQEKRRLLEVEIKELKRKRRRK